MSKNKKQPVIRYPIVTVMPNNAVYSKVIINNLSVYSQLITITDNYIVSNHIVNPSSKLEIPIDYNTNTLDVKCDFTSVIKKTQASLDVNSTSNYVTLLANTQYSNGVKLDIVTMHDLTKFGFKFPDGYEDVVLVKGTKIPDGSVYQNIYNDSFYWLANGLIFTGVNNTLNGTNRFYPAVLNNNPVMLLSNRNSNKELLFVYMPAFFTSYSEMLLINDTSVSNLFKIEGKTNVVNNTPYTIVASYDLASYFILKHTSKYFDDSVELLIPANVQKITQNGCSILTIIDSMPELPFIQVSHVSNSVNGKLDDNYSLSNTTNPDFIHKATLQLIPKTKTQDLYNQTNQPVQVISNSGTIYTINVGCLINFNFGAQLITYDVSQELTYVIVSNGEYCVVQNQMFGLIYSLPVEESQSHLIFNHTDRPVLVTAESGLIYTINPECSNIFNIGATVLMYPDFAMVNTIYCTNIVFKSNPNNTTFGNFIDLVTTSSNLVFNKTNRNLKITVYDVVHVLVVGSSMECNSGQIFVYDDCHVEINSYCTNVILGDGIISKTGPGMEVLMFKTTTNDIHNNTDRPIRVTASSGKTYTINPGSKDNFSTGSTILLYPLYRLATNGNYTSVENRVNMYPANYTFNSNYGPATLVYIKKENSSAIHNQTNKQLYILSSGTDRNYVNSNTKIVGLTDPVVLLYPDMQVVYLNGETTVQSIDYKLRPTFDEEANEDNKYFFYSNSSHSHRDNWVSLVNLKKPQSKNDFPSFYHMQGFYFEYGNKSAFNTKKD